MGKNLIKVLLAVGIVTALSLGIGDNAAARTHQRSPPTPHIVQQEQHGTERWIYVHNNQAHWIWAYFECEKSLTVTPVGLRGNRVSEVRIAGIEPDEQCSLNHWIPQIEGQSPPPWTP